MRTMHMLRFVATLLLAVARFAPESFGEEESPAAHPIYAGPKVLEQHVLWEVGRIVRFARPRPLVWKVTLDRERYLLGEPITGQIAVMNPPENEHERVEYHYKFSPPSNGSIVSTLAVWPSHQAADARWMPLKQTLEPNHGEYRPRAGFQGQPIVLRPGESRQFPLLLNTMRNNWNHWYSGPGFTEVGHYRVFLRYHNFESIFPFAHRHERAGRDEALEARDNDQREEQLEPEGIFLFGPIDVEVVAPPAAVRESLREMLAVWSSKYPSSDHGNGGTPKELTRLRALPALQDPELASLRQAAKLSSLWFTYADFKERETDGTRRARIQQVANGAETLLQESLSECLHEAVLLLYCVALNKLGQAQPARELALAAIEKSELVLPDLQVFVADLHRASVRENASDE
jgi:hypothetical protein